MNRFIIYLDIDGPLVSYLKLKDRDLRDGKHVFKTEAIDTLNAIITMFDADLCIVSTWGRKYFNGADDSIFRDFLINRGIIVNGLTFGDPDDRAGYVLRKKAEGYDRFLIIDDEALEYYKKVDDIGFNRILVPNSWRCLDEYDLVGVSRNYERLMSNYPN